MSDDLAHEAEPAAATRVRCEAQTARAIVLHLGVDGQEKDRRNLLAGTVHRFHLRAGEQLRVVAGTVEMTHTVKRWHGIRKRFEP